MADLIATASEEKAIRALKQVAQRWPKSLWLFSANGALYVMRNGEDGEHVATDNDGMDQDYILGEIKIDNDGGDW